MTTRRTTRGWWRRARVCPCGLVYEEPDLRDLWRVELLEKVPVHLWPPCRSCGAEPTEYDAEVVRDVLERRPLALRLLGFRDRLVGWEVRARSGGVDRFVRVVRVGSDAEVEAARGMLS